MISKFISTLKKPPENTPVFNPWWQQDPQNDIDDGCTKVRRKQLSRYLKERIGVATCLLVGEALGYQGGHFTGIPMTSERILLGHHTKKGILPEHVFSGLRPRRTSRPDIKPLGFSEPTATIVWGHMVQSGRDTRQTILWNAFPWHPYKPESGFLSNRTPTDKELAAGASVLGELIRMAGVETIVAVGEKSHTVLKRLGISSKKVRHPANGGATKYRQQLSMILK